MKKTNKLFNIIIIIIATTVIVSQSKAERVEWVTPLNSIDFGFVKIGTQSEKTISLQFDSDEQIMISDIEIKGITPNTFSFVTIPDIPAILQQGEKLLVAITCSPTELNIFQDSLVVTINSPFNFQYTICVNATSMAKSYVWLPDTTGPIGLNNFHFPIRGLLLDNISFLTDMKYKITLNFNSDFFLPKTVSKGRIIEDYNIGNKRVMTIEDSNVILTKDDQVLTELIGTVLLSKNSSTIVQIDKMIWGNTWLSAITKDGSIKLSDDCHYPAGLSRLAQVTHASITPSPASDAAALTIESDENGDFKLNIFSINGEIIKNIEFNANNPELKVNKYFYIIDLTKFPSGIYSINLLTPTQQLRTAFSVLK